MPKKGYIVLNQKKRMALLLPLLAITVGIYLMDPAASAPKGSLR